MHYNVHYVLKKKPRSDAAGTLAGMARGECMPAGEKVRKGQKMKKRVILIIMAALLVVMASACKVGSKENWDEKGQIWSDTVDF